MLNIGVVIPSWNAARAERTLANLTEYDSLGRITLTASYVVGAHRENERWGPVEAMSRGAQKVLSNVVPPDILVFCHDDIEVFEDWSSQVVNIFENIETVGLVGFHGATGLGSEDIYRTRYQLQQLARYGPSSNMLEAEKHGRRVTIPLEVATVDGFFMAVRRTAYEAIGGWEACLRDKIVFHMYDSWMAMALREVGYRTYLAPVSCDHSGGATEVGMAAEYEKWATENGFKDGSDVHIKGHEAFYERFRGQLPIRVY